MKKSLRNILSIAMAAMCGLGASAYDFESGGLYFNFLYDGTGTNKVKNGKVEVTYKEANNNQYNSYAGFIEVPATVTYDGETYNVTQIGQYAFRLCTSLQEVILPEGIVKISSGGFSQCKALEEITIPNSCTEIGSLGIQDCPELKTVNLGTGMKTLGSMCFLGLVSLEEITLPEGLTEIGSSAFGNCYSLKKCDIPSTVTKIGNNAFRGCYKLENFVLAPENTTFTTIDGVLFSADKKTLLIYPAGRTDTEYNIPEGTEVLAFCAFSQRVLKVTTTIDNQITLEKVSLPSTLLTIGNSAFEECTKLENVTIPASVTSIGNASFRYCDAFTEAVIPNSVTKIDQYAYAYCPNLKKVTIGSGLATLNKNAFLKSPAIESFTVMAPEVPAVNGDFVDTEVYEAATLTVPEASVEAYSENTYFSKFEKIEAAAGVDGIEADDVNAPVEYFNLQGVRVANPSAGLYIVRQGSKVTKQIVR